jgi:hypothetical protein
MTASAARVEKSRPADPCGRRGIICYRQTAFSREARRVAAPAREKAARTIEVIRVKITAAGRRALADRN